MTAERLISALGADALARLRWLVLCRFRVPPGSAGDTALSDADVLWSAAHMALDARRESGGRLEDESGEFRMERFRELKEAARER